MKITMNVLLLSILVAIGISLIAWISLVSDSFQFQNPWVDIPFTLISNLNSPQLTKINFQSLLVGFGIVFGVLYFIGDWSGPDEIIITGKKLATSKELSKLSLDKDSQTPQITIGSVPIPHKNESLQFLIAGSTGSGKTVAIEEIIEGALGRRDRLIIIDPNGTSFSKYSTSKDILFNPFDKRSKGWSIFNEIKDQYDYDRISESVIPDSASQETQVWNGYARKLLSGILEAMLTSGSNSTSKLLHLVNTESFGNLKSYVAGTHAAGLFNEHSEKTLASARFILASYIASYVHLKADSFSINDWLKNEKGNLFITWNQSMLSTLKPLMSTWVDIIIANILSNDQNNNSRIWLILDELASLEKLPSLEDGLTKGRKHGLRIVAGLQSISQLDKVYGRDSSKSIRSCFRNLVVLGGSKSDPDTAEVLSKGLGEIVTNQVHKSYSNTNNGVQTTSSTKQSQKRLVLPSEIVLLSPLNGFLALSGNYPAAKITLKPSTAQVKRSAFKKGH